MNTLNILYHMARADLLERTRRHSFLIMLALVVWLGYAAGTGIIILRVPPNYIGEINSAWVGALMTMTVTLFLGWAGFYFVKGSVARDYETGVGQIMASTQLTRPIYTLGKWLSNFVILNVMIFILAIAGIVMNLAKGTGDLELSALIAPLLIIALPALAIVAALAVLFESISWLRGGVGNVIYFLMFMLLMIPGIEAKRFPVLLDLWGFRLVGDSIAHAAKVAYPESGGGFAFTLSSAIGNPRLFSFEGLTWNAEIILIRASYLLVAVAIVLVAALFFDRFSATDGRLLRKRKSASAASSSRQDHSADATTPNPLPARDLHLTPLATRCSRFRYGTLYHAELKLLLKGHPWWWYAVTLGLMIAQFASELEIARILLAVTWVWPILLLSGLGSREVRYNTQQMVFSAPRPILHQLPAVWLAAFTVIALMGSGAFLNFLLAGQTTSLLAWLGGALFIPSLALAVGVLTGGNKTFEVVYIIWMYIIVQKVPALDFVGIVPESPWYIYAPLALALCVLCALARQRQLTGKLISG